MSPSKHLKHGSPTNAGGEGSSKLAKPLVRQILMRENAKGHLSKAHLYVPMHDDREVSGGHHKSELFKKMIIKERKEESDSSDFSNSSRKLYDDTEEDLRTKRETQSSFKKSF